MACPGTLTVNNAVLASSSILDIIGGLGVVSRGADCVVPSSVDTIITRGLIDIRKSGVFKCSVFVALLDVNRKPNV